jgi:hypothetical protein
MVRQFHGAWLAVGSACAHAKPGDLKPRLIILIHAVVAVVLFGAVFTTIDRVQEGFRQDIQPLLTRSRGTVCAFVWKGTREWHDDIV